MRKIKDVFTLISIFLLGIGLIGAVLGLRYAILLNARHHLLCEVLQPGISESEVLAILEQFGKFRMNRGEWGGGYIDLGITFTDIKGRILYGSFNVHFHDYEYRGAYQRFGFEPASDITICYFPKIAEPDVETPSP